MFTTSNAVKVGIVVVGVIAAGLIFKNFRGQIDLLNQASDGYQGL